MAVVYDFLRRLEADPRLEDLARGFQAETADPAWFLGRQWQLGEHLGEDASSPVRVEYRPSLVAVDPLGGDPRMDPRATPAEAIVESEPEDFWTAGRRVAAGQRVAAALAAAGRAPLTDPQLVVGGLPAPYDVLDGSGLDGRARSGAAGSNSAWTRLGSASGRPIPRQPICGIRPSSLTTPTSRRAASA